MDFRHPSDFTAAQARESLKLDDQEDDSNELAKSADFNRKSSPTFPNTTTEREVKGLKGDDCATITMESSQETNNQAIVKIDNNHHVFRTYVPVGDESDSG